MIWADNLGRLAPAERQNEEERSAFLEQLRIWQADPTIELWFADECGVEGDPRPRRRWSARATGPKRLISETISEPTSLAQCARLPENAAR